MVTKIIVTLAAALSGTQHWYGAALTVVVLSLLWHPALGILAGVVLDMLYSAPPTGVLQYVPLPFTLSALCIAALQRTGKKFLTTGEWRRRIGS